jgi:muramoyltetrapeptide carboxypeptidase
MGTQIINTPSLMDKVLDVIKSKDVVLSLTALNDSAKQVTKMSAPITGGNLTLIGNTISTTAEIAPKGKILVLEDINEKGYALYRELVHLKQAKILDDVKTIVFGEFTKGDDHIDTAIKIFAYPNDSPNAEQIGIKEVPCFRTEDLVGSATYPCILGCTATISWNFDCGKGELTMKSPFEVIE